MKCAREDCNKLVKEYGSKYCSRECYNRSLREGKSIQRKRVTVECASCGKPVEKRPCEVRKHNFCGKECYGQWLSANKVGENSNGWKGRIEKICPNCGSVLSVPGYSIKKKHDRKFCNKECFYEYAKKTEENKGENHPRYGKPVSEETKIKLSLKNKGKKRSDEVRKKLSEGHKGEKAYNYCKTEIPCDNCGKTLMRVPSTTKEHNFCNRKCHSEWASRVMVGPLNSRYGKTWSEEARAKFMESWKKRREDPSYVQKKHTPETKRKQRIAAIKRMQKQSKAGEVVVPSFNFTACEFFAQFDKQFGINGQYATNGGEFHIKELGYFVDYFNPDVGIIMEWDEEYHYKKGKLSQKDVERQREIENYFPDFEFLRVRESKITKTNGVYNI